MALQKKSSRGYRESVSGLAKDPPPSVATDSNVPRLRSSSTLKASPSAQQRTRDAQTFRRQTLTAVGRLQSQAQAHLSTAVTSERARQWHVVIDSYRQLLLALEKFPPEFVPGPDYTQLLFETYYHIGVAFQKLDCHRKAVEEYTSAIEIVHTPKNACQVGCVSRSFFHTPVYARRAYAYVKCDNIRKAIDDANRTVYLDSSNPDVYCIRALVWSSAKEKKRALIDLNFSSKLDSSHVCTLIIRGAIMNSLGSTSASVPNKDHDKALRLCYDSKHYLDVTDFTSPKMASFYDRFLWRLNAFHTILEINLFAGATLLSPSPNLNSIQNQRSKAEPFKCGTPTVYPDKTCLLRRKIYSQSLLSSGSEYGISERIRKITQQASEWSELNEAKKSSKKE